MKLHTISIGIASMMMVFMTGCIQQQETTGTKIQVNGNLVYRERMALPPNAIGEVTLFCMESGERKAISSVSVAAEGRSIPLPFMLEGTIKPSQKAADCSLEGRLLEGSDVIFATSEPLLLPKETKDIELLLHRVLPKAEQESSTSAAPTPSPVVSGVDMAALLGSRWKVRTLYGNKAETFPDQEEPHLVFLSTEGSWRFAGSDGCNRIMGIVPENVGKSLFGHLGTTMMMCPKGDAQAKNIAKALSETTSWTLNDNILRLLVGNEVVMELESVAL